MDWSASPSIDGDNISPSLVPNQTPTTAMMNTNQQQQLRLVASSSSDSTSTITTSLPSELIDLMVNGPNGTLVPIWSTLRGLGYDELLHDILQTFVALPSNYQRTGYTADNKENTSLVLLNKVSIILCIV